jgi:hypothetical protein
MREADGVGLAQWVLGIDNDRRRCGQTPGQQSPVIIDFKDLDPGEPPR